MVTFPSLLAQFMSTDEANTKVKMVSLDLLLPRRSWMVRQVPLLDIVPDRGGIEPKLLGYLALGGVAQEPISKICSEGSSQPLLYLFSLMSQRHRLSSRPLSKIPLSKSGLRI